MLNIYSLKRKLARLTARKNQLEARHKGNEEKFTYHGGFDLGYLKGQITELEDFIDYLHSQTEPMSGYPFLPDVPDDLPF